MLIAFSGFKTSGKDTAARVLLDEYGFIKIAFADALREALLVLNPIVTYQDGTIITNLSTVIKGSGWDWAKSNIPEVRRLMQVFGTEVGRTYFGDNVWVDTLANKFPDIFDDETRYVITDCRFENECEFVRNGGGQIVWIDRPGLGSDGHASESDVPFNHAVAVLHNDETIEELEEDVRFFLFMRGIDKVDSAGITSEGTD
jgi:hypothetical protein